MTCFAFEVLEARRLVIRCDTRNLRSKAVPERLGYVLEGCLRNSQMDTSGRPADMLVYAMTPQDYERARGG
jgi:RimJ/RimL family protein N-acetyltransferase